MRICMYTEEAFPRMGGKAAVIDALVRQYLALGHEVVVLATRHRSVAERPLVPYPVVRHPRFYSQRWFVDCYRWWLGGLQRKYGFDVLHCHSVHPAGYVASRCRAVAGIPLVITSHGDVCSKRFSWQKGLRQRHQSTLARADATIAMSEFMEGRIRELCPNPPRIERIPNGVDIAQFSQAVERPGDLDASIRPGEYLLFVGRLVPRKGGDLLLDAFAQMGGPSRVKLVIAGDGPSRAQWLAQAERLGVAERVRFVGSVDGQKKTYLYQHALCTVVPSRISEAFGLVPVESYAAGRPVIATEIPGLHELIVPDQTGLLVAPESAGALAEALTRAVDNSHWLDQLGQQARRFAQSYDWRNIAERHLSLYAELAGRARQAA